MRGFLLNSFEIQERIWKSSHSLGVVCTVHVSPFLKGSNPVYNTWLNIVQEKKMDSTKTSYLSAIQETCLCYIFQMRLYFQPTMMEPGFMNALLALYFIFWVKSAIFPTFRGKFNGFRHKHSNSLNKFLHYRK